MTKLKLSLAITTALLIAAPAWAEGSTGPSAPAGTAATTPTAFQTLSPGEQKLARALFLAQQPTAVGPAPLSLNQIAALKEHEGWGEVFKQMQAEGLVHDKNLGQVVSAYEHHLHAPTGNRGGPMVVTKGTGRSSFAGSIHDGKASNHQDASGPTGGESSSYPGAGDRDDTITVANASGASHGESGAASGGTHGSAGAHGH